MRRLSALVVPLIAILLLSACSPQPQAGDGPAATSTAPSNTPTAAAIKSDARLDGKLLFTKQRTLWQLSDGSAKQLGKDTGVQQPSWSADGKKVTYVKMEVDYSDIWVMSASGGDQANLTRFGRSGADTWGFNPRWSPDGSQIAYVSDQSTYDLALWAMKADGSGRRQVTIMNDWLGGIDSPAWHPKGDRIAFTAYRTGKPQVWALTLANSRWQQLADMPEGSYEPQWSPSGEMLAFVARDGGKSNVYALLTAEGKPQQVSLDGLSRAPAWSPDGKVLAFISGQGGKFDIWAATLDKAADGSPRLNVPKRMTTGLNADPAGGLSWAK